MNVLLIFFLFLGLVAVASALGTLFSRNTIYSALFLIVNFATVAVFYLQLNAPFIALSQITVYAGAIMVLFLFVIMLLSAERTNRPGAPWWDQPLALVLGAALLVETAYLVLNQRNAFPALQPLPAGFGAPAVIGQLLFNQYLLPFEVTSILLLTSMVGVIVLSIGERRRKGVRLMDLRRTNGKPVELMESEIKPVELVEAEPNPTEEKMHNP
jgi:NADH-quinone oxidoreductase subunit J